MVSFDDRVGFSVSRGGGLNCIGTALYLSGVRDNEEYIGGFERYYDYFSKLVRVNLENFAKGRQSLCRELKEQVP